MYTKNRISEKETFLMLDDLTGFKSVVSYGCGVSSLEVLFAEKFKDVTCIDRDDVNWYFIKACLKPNSWLKFECVDFMELESLKSCDLAIFTEVAQLYPDDILIPFLQKLCRSSKYIFFSSHPESLSVSEEEVNIKKPEAWLQVFKSLGMNLITRISYPHENGFLFERL
ncbi:hypothetical protein [Chondrinema litorale]|uniref:hypothetical protein n=1 Tax=Chondrinema litorale TaxID=2994555 RepID=UPI002542D63C|nr:hypothetical protein [Chondrinema litorale]UZS00275.1 hypothetical protein OQ292_40755 [Chondrinema litorale]